MPPNAKGVLFGLLGYAFFSSHDAIIKYLGATYSPFQIVFFSVLFGFPLVSLMLMGDARADNLRPKHPWWTMLRTVALLASFVSVFYAFSVLPLAEVYALLFTMPLFVTMLSIPILGERVGLHRFGAIVAGLAGVIFILKPDTMNLSLGHGAALVGAFGSALASAVVRRIGREERDAVLLLMPMLANFLVMGAILPFYYVPMEIKDLGGMALLAVLSFSAFLCMIAAYKWAEASIVAPMQYSQILWALMFGAIIFGETPDADTLGGVVLIIASGLYIVFRESKKDISQNTPVLRSRSRLAGGGYFSIGLMLRAARRRKKI